MTDTWFRDDCVCLVLDSAGDGCSGTADTTEPTHLCRHCLAHGPDGYWQAAGDITQDVADALKAALVEVRKSGQELVVVEGVTLQWVPRGAAMARG